jgi:hypothetical protein
MVASNQVQVTLSDPDSGNKLSYTITTADNKLAQDWLIALDEILARGLNLNKSYCFLGFPNTPRNIEYLCDQMNRAIYTINTYNWTQHDLPLYRIEDWFSRDTVRFGPEYVAPPQMFPEMLYHSTKHEIMNRIHHHFERLQGTVEAPSYYFQVAPAHIRQAIGRLNTLCHEIENLVLSQRKHILLPEWTRPVQITTFNNATRYELTDEHRLGFLANGFNRKLGGVYMHWAQIGKTYFEVFRDEDAPVLTETVCEAITQLKYYSGEFDVEWGKTIVDGVFDWHDKQMHDFKTWLLANNIDPNNPANSLGYLHIGDVDVEQAFGTTDSYLIWEILGKYLNIHSITTANASYAYNYTWRDQDV